MEMAEKQCQNSIVVFFKKFHINPQDIPKQIEIVPNGILYNFQLQKVGI
jgi:hypothetical protein